VPGFDLEAQRQSFAPLFDRFGGHAQAIGLTLWVDRIGELRSGLESACRGIAQQIEPQADGNLWLGSLSASFYAQLRARTFWGGEPSAGFPYRGRGSGRGQEPLGRLRQGRHTLEAFHWKVDVRDRMRGDWLIEFRSKTRNVCGFVPE
jgi:hypothetical protein